MFDKDDEKEGGNESGDAVEDEDLKYSDDLVESELRLRQVAADVEHEPIPPSPAIAEENLYEDDKNCSS